MANLNQIYYDSANAHALRLLEIKEDGRYMFDDLEDNTRVICNADGFDAYPRRVEEFKPVNCGIKDDKPMTATEALKHRQMIGRVHRHVPTVTIITDYVGGPLKL